MRSALASGSDNDLCRPVDVANLAQGLRLFFAKEIGQRELQRCLSRASGKRQRDVKVVGRFGDVDPLAKHLGIEDRVTFRHVDDVAHRHVPIERDAGGQVEL